EQLTEAKTGVGAFEWSPDGKWIAYLAQDAPTETEEKKLKEKDDARVVDDFKMNHVWVVPVVRDESGKREARQVTKGDFDVREIDWSPDGRNIAIVHAIAPTVDAWTTSDISIVDAATGQRKPLAASGAAESSPIHSPDGKWIAFTATTNPPSWAQEVTIHVVPATGGTPRALAPTPDNQPSLVGWSADGKWIYCTETRGTVGRFSALPTDGGPSRDLSAGDGVMGAVSLNRARSAIGFSWQTSERPAEAYVSALDRWQPLQISRHNEALAKLPMGRTELVRWKAKDGVEIEGLLTYPVSYQPGKRVPLLLVIHGGPAGVFVRSFLGNRGSYPLAVFAANGYAILRCNIRGSGGYGAKFRRANFRDWGGMDYQDLMLGVDQTVALGIADPDRLGVMGWSYGGFMTSWVITQTRRFKAASIGAPVTNLMSFTGTTDIPSFVPDYMGAEFWNDLEVYRKHSAMFNIKGVTTPSLIQHGERDERVHYTQGMELYNALKRQGVPVKMIAYPRQPHGVGEPRLQRDVMQRNLDWFAQYVKP
ncbi:MAG: S9 family peptidase, partial [Planctomycetes bacterium]|nr:S9 family peptidase [Planctomycetota bacterium]